MNFDLVVEGVLYHFSKITETSFLVERQGFSCIIYKKKSWVTAEEGISEDLVEELGEAIDVYFKKN
jgi:hypothetical protein